MKTIIAGSRTITKLEHVEAAVANSGFASKIRVVLSGGARGVDQLGETWARGLRIQIHVFPANWKEEGRAAGFKRNERMANAADALIAVWDGRSKGTKHMIDIAKKKGLQVYVHKVKKAKK